MARGGLVVKALQGWYNDAAGTACPRRGPLCLARTAGAPALFCLVGTEKRSFGRCVLVFASLFFAVVAAVKFWRGVTRLLGRRPSKEVLTGTHVPLYDKASGACDLLAALGFGLLSGGNFYRNVLELPLPGWVLGALFGLAVLMLLLALVADTVFRQENFY